MFSSGKKTLEEIDKFIKSEQEYPHRRHLGASIIGTSCERALWYGFRWAAHENFSARMLRLFNRGHVEEERFIRHLRSVGVQVWEAGEHGDLKKQMRISDCHGHFGGTPDAIVKGLLELPEGEPCLGEFKTHNDKSFKKLLSDGLLMTKWQHFIQMQIYMFKLNLNYGAYFAVNKNDDSLHLEILQLDVQKATEALEKASRVIWTPTPLPRISAKPSGYQCRFCEFARLCHFGDVKPDYNCRTCKYSLPLKDGSGNWECTYKPYQEEFNSVIVLDEEAQKRACPNYSINPLLQGRQE